MLKFTSLYALELPLKIWVGGKLLIPSSTSGTTFSLFEIFGLLISFLPFKPMLDALCPIIYFQNS
jgi:hypothetical protein